MNKVDDDAPADTSMMRIVHDALRRDLARAATTLTQTSDAEQRRAVGGHLGWLMSFLHAHHESEDAGLYPLTRERAAGDTATLAVLDEMGRDHEGIASAIVGVESAGADLAGDPSDGAAERAAAALEALSAALLPHLRREEDEAMPIVSELVTRGEWRALEQKHNLDPKSTTELGFEGHWLIDGATDEDRATVLSLVPPLPRFVLLHGFAGRYRRHLRRCWGGPAVPRRVQLHNAVEVTVDTGIDAVWDLVSDPTRVGEWSHECVAAEWLDGNDRARVGARFRGRNRAGLLRWGRICELEAVAPYEVRWRTVPTRLYPDSSVWSIALEDLDGRTRITQRFRVVRAPRVLSVLYALIIPAHRDRTAALVADLQRLGRAAQERVGHERSA